jgi:hypothetical protein
MSLRVTTVHENARSALQCGSVLPLLSRELAGGISPQATAHPCTASKQESSNKLPHSRTRALHTWLGRAGCAVCVFWLAAWAVPAQINGEEEESRWVARRPPAGSPPADLLSYYQERLQPDPHHHGAMMGLARMAGRVGTKFGRGRDSVPSSGRVPRRSRCQAGVGTLAELGSQIRRSHTALLRGPERGSTGHRGP